MHIVLITNHSLPIRSGFNDFALISMYLICLKKFPVKWKLTPHKMKWKATVISKLKTENKQMRTGISYLNRLISFWVYLMNWYMNGCGQPIRASVIIFSNIMPFVSIGKHIMHTRDYRKHGKLYSISHRWEPFSINKWVQFYKHSSLWIISHWNAVCTSGNEVAIATLFIW